MGVNVKWMLQSIHTNFMQLTHTIPMVQVKDLPEAMQYQVVGVPRAWVWFFRQLARAVVTFHDQNPPSPPQAQTPGSDTFYTTVNLYFGGSEAPFLYYDTCVLSHFGCLMKNFYDDLFIYLHV